MKTLLSPAEAADDARRIRRCLWRFITAIGPLVALAGTGCVGVFTRQVVEISQPHKKLVAHELLTLDAAFVANDGQLRLHATGRPAGQREISRLTLTLPPSPPVAGRIAQRVVVPATVVQAEPGVTATNAPGSWQSILVGPPLVFNGTTTYEWERLAPASGARREVRLVRRPGAPAAWEVLLLTAVGEESAYAYTVYEVRGQLTEVRHRAALALMPVVMALDAVEITLTRNPNQVWTHEVSETKPWREMDPWRARSNR